jgi:ABC-type Fe3+ transport system substrate-binding protein
MEGGAKLQDRCRRHSAGIMLAAMALPIATMLTAPARAENSSWDETVKRAIAEGEVNVHGGPGAVYRRILTEGFNRAFPQIKINFDGLSGRDAVPKIVRERAAGIYSVDVYTGGTSSILQSLKPIAAFEPLREALILPEVLDDKAWLGGLDGGWIDKDQKYIFGFEATVSPMFLVNWDLISHDQLKTYDDLMKPEFAGKIVWDDPRLPGQGVSVAQRFLINFGADWLKRLFTEQKIAYIANPRQAAEWVVRGKYPIGLGVAAELVQPFQQQGLGKNVSPFTQPLPHPALEYGYGTLSLLSHAPHPNAAKVYVNWLLSKAGQKEWTTSGENSRRIDIPIANPDTAAQPGVAYSAEQSEENFPIRQQSAAIAKEFISGQP